MAETVYGGESLTMFRDCLILEMRSLATASMISRLRVRDVPPLVRDLGAGADTTFGRGSRTARDPDLVADELAPTGDRSAEPEDGF